MKNHLFRAFLSGFLLLAVMLCLTACGKKETAPESIVNWTLPDVASFEENYTSERETAVAEKAEPEAESYRWKPHGVYTYVYGTSGEDGAGQRRFSKSPLRITTSAVQLSPIP